MDGIDCAWNWIVGNGVGSLFITSLLILPLQRSCLPNLLLCNGLTILYAGLSHGEQQRQAFHHVYGVRLLVKSEADNRTRSRGLRGGRWDLG